MQLKEKRIEGKQKGIFLVWPEKTKFALEEYIFSRFYMYQSVYFHHTTRGFEGLLRKILRRAQDLAKQNKRFAKTLLGPMELILGGKDTKDIRKLRNLTDHVLLAQVGIWQDDKDKILSDLSMRLLQRKGIGWIETVGYTPFQKTETISSIRDYLKEKGHDPEYYFFEDIA